MKIGFTGTRKEPTDMQLDWLWSYLPGGDELHHGACVGSDAAAHQAAIDCGLAIVVHPPVNPTLRMSYDGNGTWLPARPYLIRNRDIVDATDELIALVDGPETQKSGTWMTIRYARAVGRSLTICDPDGTVSHE